MTSQRPCSTESDGRTRNATSYVLDGGSSEWVLVRSADGARTLVRVTWAHNVEKVCTVDAAPAAWVVRELDARDAAIPARPPRAVEMAARRAVRPEWRAKLR